MRHSFILLIILSFVASIGANAQREVKMQVGDSTEVLKRYVFMFLNDGPKRDQDSATLVRIQEGHMKHIGEMAQTGKMVVAGPFEDAGKYRGILIFDVDSISQAIRMESTDPGVVSGRFEMQAFFWWTMKGSKLP